MAEDRIFKELKQDHDRQRALLDQILETSGDSPERQTLFDKLRVELQAHAAAEEMALYAPMLGDPDLRDEARHSVAEHKEIDDMLGELVETPMSSSGWLTKFKSLDERYRHHIEEEEEEMFPAAAKEMDKASKKVAAEVFEDRKPEEKERAKDELPGDSRE